MKKINTTIDINVSAEKVWDTLTNLACYPKWNPFITKISGTLKVGSELTVTIKPPLGKGMTFKPKVLVSNAINELRWLGKPGGIPFIASGEHYFIIIKNSMNRVEFIQGEKFSGVLVPFMGSVWKDTENGFNLMNEALKAKLEAMP